jgi:hypothetical protein
MHLVVSWDITDVPNRSAIADEMIGVLKPYSWARPLTTFYIVHTDVFGRETIQRELTAIGQKYPAWVRFLISPLMQGQYQGFLTKNDWDNINARTI